MWKIEVDLSSSFRWGDSSCGMLKWDCAGLQARFQETWDMRAATAQLYLHA